MKWKVAKGIIFGLRLFCNFLWVGGVRAGAGYTGFTNRNPDAIPTPTPIPTPTISPEKLAEFQEVFDIVWHKVNETYFDPDFNGVDWDAMYDEYLPKTRSTR